MRVQRYGCIYRCLVIGKFHWQFGMDLYPCLRVPTICDVCKSVIWTRRSVEPVKISGLSVQWMYQIDLIHSLCFCVFLTIQIIQFSGTRTFVSLGIILSSISLSLSLAALPFFLRSSLSMTNSRCGFRFKFGNPVSVSMMLNGTKSST